jgi:hypothetical protein
MIFDDTRELTERIEALSGRKLYSRPRIVEDTTSVFGVQSGCVLRLGTNDYYIRGDTHEGRFGIDDQPKFWAKYATCLTTGESKIIKLTFHEQFRIDIGPVKGRCTRSPEKESRILDLVRGHPRFMQGTTVRDVKGNNVRVIQQIPGSSLYGTDFLANRSHEAYFREHMPVVLREVVACIEAVAFLHAHGEHHGDIRNDHILIDSRDGLYKWIDFDADVNYGDYDAWSIGNVINFAVGGAIHTFHDVQKNPDRFPHLRAELTRDDAMMLLPHRVANLQKLYPYIPTELNDILMHFSHGATRFYDDVVEELADLRAMLLEPAA